MPIPVTPRRVKEVAGQSRVVQKIVQERQTAFHRFPLFFTLLAAFGLVAIFYGFERLIDKVDLFSENPFILLATGVITLIITGTLYKKL